MTFFEGIKDFLKDLFNPQALIFKCIYVLLLAAVVIIWPQFTIHQKALGLTEYQTGIISTVTSTVAIFYPICSGIIGDKVGNFRIPMVVVSMTTGVIAFLFTWVPVGQSIVLNASNATDLIYDTNSSDPNKTMVEVVANKQALTFWTYIAIRTLFAVFQGATFTLYDAAVMANTQNSNINYGYQRSWGTIGAIASSYLGGVIAENTGGFNEIFYASAVLHVATGIAMLGVKIDFKIPATSLTKDLLLYFFKAEVLLFFGAIASAGMFVGYLETFMYRYLFALGATPFLIGLTVTVGAPFEFVLTIAASYFTKRIGYVPLIVFGLLAYGIRFLGLSFLQDPWWVLPLEALDSVANGLLNTAAIMYCAVLFPTQVIASFRGVFAIIYFGAGRLVGITVGSEIREQLGHVITFWIWACVAFVCAISYYLAFTAMKNHKSSNFSLKDVHGREETRNNEKLKGISNDAFDAITVHE
ncbi:major facilitator superfamily domain-containing protein 6-like [Palaemon carinicauda]|uniref:major facilitator superfamily domain-containing protein 6-like n=1 Tax=Palaemon carinicauda TaxID=392227 RepID=UPI0035B6A5BF